MARLLAIIALLLATMSASAACEGERRLVLDSNVDLVGVLKSGKGQHEAQGAFDYVYLELEAPVCVDAAPPAPGDSDSEEGDSIPEPVSRMQIAGDLLDTDLPVGSRVSVAGSIFAAHTMWHAEDVLIDASTIEKQ